MLTLCTRRKKRCSGKVRHPSRGKAEAAMRSIQRLHPKDRFSVYSCSFCMSWHVGHYAPGNPKNKYRRGTENGTSEGQ